MRRRLTGLEILKELFLALKYSLIVSQQRNNDLAKWIFIQNLH